MRGTRELEAQVRREAVLKRGVRNLGDGVRFSDA